MNKLIISNDNIEYLESDGKIEVILSNKLELFDITKIKITFMESTSLEIEYKNEEESKFDIVYCVLENVVANILEIRREAKSKIQYKYYLDRYSKLDVLKFYDCDEVREMDIINLNGEYAEINYHLKTISKNKQKFDCLVYHNYPNTISNVSNSGANMLDGTLNIQVTSIVYSGIKNCTINQNSRILTLNQNKCNINPNLLIEEDEVIANHSAMIGTFNEEELFYLQSRGIKRNKAINLLVKGFLVGDLENDLINQIINNYWR